MDGFAERLKGRRLSLGLGLREVARRADIGAGYYCDLENGRKTDPGLKIAHRIALALGTNIYELFAVGEDEPACPHGSAVWFDPHNGVVQCHRCGEVFVPRSTCE